ncbi:MAG: divergent polysaccharide deacetylase family protein [Candidatus Aminicenantes bacterium]|nr:divergent polysaccharide deacetylase family protein [Candidatus Aminicenantes bacterium]
MRRLPNSVLILVPVAALGLVFYLVQTAGDLPSTERPGRDCLAPAVIRALLSAGVEGEAVSSSPGQGPCPILRVSLRLETYLKIGSLLEKTLDRDNVFILAKEKAEGAEPRFVWRLRGPDQGVSEVFFDVIVPSSPPPPSPRAAIIVDDMGYSPEAVDALCRLGVPITASILPFTPASGEVVAKAEACGLETMLHLPLESLGAQQGWRTSVDGTILTKMSPEDIRLAVEAYLDAFPRSQGVNNHAGSLFTEDAALLNPIFDVLKERNLFFIDSRTSEKSVAYEEAVRRGVPAAARQVFLDADSDSDGVRRRLVELFAHAKAHGRAVGIAHPRKETLEALARHIGLAGEMGVRLVFASAVAE